MFGYIYLTTNLVNGKVYVGQKKAKKFNPNYLGSGKLIKQAIEKYGKDKFFVEPIACAESRSELNSLEIKFISDYRNEFHDKCYNISEGGIGKVRNDFPQKAVEARYNLWNNGTPPQWHQSDNEATRIPIVAINLNSGLMSFFISHSEASKSIPKVYNNISRVLSGERKKAGNHSFRLATQEEINKYSNGDIIID